MLNSRYRLKSSAFERAEENCQIEPKRVIFLSVEGDCTEKDYFVGLNRELDSSIIQIEVLRHKDGDGYSDPAYVIELLEEYLTVRQGQLIPDDILEKITKKYSNETINTYLNAPANLDDNTRKEIQTDLLELKIDIDYRRYLQQFNEKTDLFGVVIDRDHESHSRDLMLSCKKHCEDEGINFYVSNPCFEFWLLLHLCDISTEYDQAAQKKMLLNPRESVNHTFVSHEVSSRAHHAKGISMGKFKNTYLPNIRTAIERSKNFATQFPDLLDQLGTNVPDLFKEIGFPAP